MSLLDDLKAAGFGENIGSALSEIANIIKVNKFRSALEELAAKEKEPIPTREALERVKEGLPIPTQEDVATGLAEGVLQMPEQVPATFAPVSSQGIPEMQSQLDRIMRQMSSRQDIIGRFLPGIAMVNPALAKTLAEEALAGKQYELGALREKAGLVETEARLEETKALRGERAREFDIRIKEIGETRDVKHKEFLMNLETRRQQDAAMMNYRYDALANRLRVAMVGQSKDTAALALRTFSEKNRLLNQYLDDKYKAEEEVANLDFKIRTFGNDLPGFRKAVALGSIKNVPLVSKQEELDEIVKGWQAQRDVATTRAQSLDKSIEEQKRWVDNFVLQQELSGFSPPPEQPKPEPSKYRIGEMYESSRGEKFMYMGGDEKDIKNWKRVP